MDYPVEEHANKQPDIFRFAQHDLQWEDKNLESTMMRHFAMKPFGLDGTQQKPQPKEIMDWKKFFIAFVAAFGFIFFFGFIWYGKLMQSAYREIPVLWRPEADFGSHFSWLVFGHIVMAFFLTLLCAKFVPKGGADTCALLGLFVALIYVGAHLITFAVQPITSKILWGWNVGALVQFAVAGAIIGVIYKPSVPATIRV